MLPCARTPGLTWDGEPSNQAPRISSHPRAALLHSLSGKRGSGSWKDPGDPELVWAVQLPGKLGRLQDSPAWEDVGRKGAGDGVCALGHRGHLPPFPNLAGTDRGDVLAVRVVPITFTQALTSPLGLAASFWDFSGFGGRETALSTLVWGPVLCWEGAGPPEHQGRLALCPGCRQELYPASQPPLLFSRSCFQPRVL